MSGPGLRCRLCFRCVRPSFNKPGGVCVCKLVCLRCGLIALACSPAFSAEAKEVVAVSQPPGFHAGVGGVRSGGRSEQGFKSTP